MLCALLNFAECANGKFYDLMAKKFQKKEDEYSNLPLISTVDIIQALNVNLEDDYEYNENTVVVLIDLENETTTEFGIDQAVADSLNAIPAEYRGIVLCDSENHITEDED
jgi:hypothetical protein